MSDDLPVYEMPDRVPLHHVPFEAREVVTDESGASWYVVEYVGTSLGEQDSARASGRLCAVLALAVPCPLKLPAQVSLVRLWRRP